MYRKWCETHLLCESMFSVCFYIFVAVINKRYQIGVYTFFPGYQLNQQIDLNHLRAYSIFRIFFIMSSFITIGDQFVARYKIRICLTLQFFLYRGLFRYSVR